MNKNRSLPSLLACIVMDMLGYATYSLPIIGEVADIIWAPISAMIFFMMFRGWKGAFGGMFNFVEELMPGLDFIPTFTLTWLWQYFTRSQKVEQQNANTENTIYISGRNKPAHPVTNR
jgi:hypothetical protein